MTEFRYNGKPISDLSRTELIEVINILRKSLEDAKGREILGAGTVESTDKSE